MPVEKMQIVSHAEVDPGLNISDSAATHMLQARKLLELKVSDLLKALSDMSWRSAVWKKFFNAVGCAEVIACAQVAGSAYSNSLKHKLWTAHRSEPK